MKISDIAIDRPVFTTMCTVAMMVMGFMALGRLGIDLFPDISFPVVAITTTYPGAGPEEVEQQVSVTVFSRFAPCCPTTPTTRSSRNSIRAPHRS